MTLFAITNYQGGNDFNKLEYAMSESFLKNLNFSVPQLAHSVENFDSTLCTR
jgi:hypothetical protein